MNFVIGILAPTVIASLLVWLIRRVLSPDPAERYVLATACGAAIFVGYLVIPGFASLAPTSRWQWLPYVGVMAAMVSCLPARGGALGALRWTLIAAAGLLAAWKLVPMWENLWPPRTVSIALLAAGLITVTAGLEWLPNRLCGTALPGLLALAATAVMVVLVAAAVSAKYAQAAGLLAGALTGCWLAGLRHPALPESIRGLLPIYALYLAGLAYMGSVERDPPVLPLLGMPLT